MLKWRNLASPNWILFFWSKFFFQVNFVPSQFFSKSRVWSDSNKIFSIEFFFSSATFDDIFLDDKILTVKWVTNDHNQPSAKFFRFDFFFKSIVFKVLRLTTYFWMRNTQVNCVSMYHGSPPAKFFFSSQFFFPSQIFSSATFDDIFLDENILVLLPNQTLAALSVHDHRQSRPTR